MREADLLCLGKDGFHRMHYVEWGDSDARKIVICVHGLTRSSRDFDTLAQALLPEFRVVCPDVIGRGKSEWLEDKEDYSYSQYCADMAALIARVNAGDGPRHLYWVGTSMGGIIGMLLASRPKSPIERLVVNDVGMMVPKSALERLAAYVGKDPRFTSFQELVGYMRVVSASFGPLTDDQWHHLARHNAMKHADGTWGFNYDPGIGIPFRESVLEDVNLLSVWDQIACPTLLIRGADSDLLPREVALQMTQRGPRPRLVEFADVGHAPMLLALDQIAVVREFLLS
ncbi:MAG: alpha/beta hydrolase [Betaproteobacteria bacterium]|nr:alpha/beta hydrolase [Betaproteobacteria bacterium]MDH3436847.1 alpha/beta hydrolase [Betaproteobacteria bacterium]